MSSDIVYRAEKVLHAKATPSAALVADLVAEVRDLRGTLADVSTALNRQAGR